MFKFLIFCAVLAAVSADGYWDIQLSPQSIASVPYGPGHISVWQHATTTGRYYAMPLVYLQKESARTKSNILTGIQEMSFDVMMWSVEAKEAVYRHIRAEINASVSLEHVEMLPMEKIRIVWRDRIRPIAPQFKLVDHWKSNTHLPSVVTFQFTCNSAEACNQLKGAMLDSPEMFNALELEYVINGQRSARRSLTVTGSHLREGRLWTNLTNMNAGDTRYLTSDDLKTIVSESVRNVLGTLVTDSDYVDTGDEVNMKQILQHVLETHQVSTEQFEPHQWESVFWNPTWARPDKLTQYLNKVLSKDTSDSRKFLLDESARTRAGEGKASGSFLKIISVSGGGSSSSSSQSKVQKEDVLNTLRERHSNIEWTGEVFRVKPMKLYRLNLSTLRSTTNIATANIQVRRYETVHTIKLRLTGSTAQTPSLTPQLVMARLSEKITQTNAKLNQTDSKLKSTESRLTNQINANKNSVNSRLGPMQTKLNTLPGWPSGGYCILANGACPPGFTRYSGHIWAISTYDATPTYITSLSFGDSSISCHGRCNQYNPWRADLNLVSCCR